MRMLCRLARALRRTMRWCLHRLMGPIMLTLVTAVGCRRSDPLGSQPIPLVSRPPWVSVLADSGFRILMDTSRVVAGPDRAWLVWFITLHAQVQGPDSMRFDRGRIRLLVRCNALAFKSVSEELALGDARPVFYRDWPLTGPNAAPWRSPPAGATDGRLLAAACTLLRARDGAA